MNVVGAHRLPATPTALPRLAAAPVRSDARGFGLVELLIALMVLNVGIFATVAAFNAGVLALRRASHVSAAGGACRQGHGEASLDAVHRPRGAVELDRTRTGPGRPNVHDRDLFPDRQPRRRDACARSPYEDGRAVIVVTVVVRDPQDGDKVLVRAGSTFEECTQDRTRGRLRVRRRAA